jgi:hypothetical protein
MAEIRAPNAADTATASSNAEAAVGSGYVVRARRRSLNAIEFSRAMPDAWFRPGGYHKKAFRI